VNVVDRDGGRLGRVERFSIQGQGSQYFSVDSEGYIFNHNPLDYESSPNLIRLSVCAYDVDLQSSCEVFSVNLLDENDHTPQFSQETYVAEIMEGTVVRSLLHVSAVDMDGSATFSEIHYTWGDSFSAARAGEYGFVLAERTGVINITHIFDFETDLTHFGFIAKATDGGGLSSTALINVTVTDRNEYVPSFQESYYNISVPESFPLNIPFYTIEASDADGSQLYGEVREYQVLELNNRQQFPFQINSDGTFTVRTRLDYEAGPTLFSFSLAAVDGGGLRSTPVSVTIFVLDAEDSPPEFEPSEYSVTVRENFIPTRPLVNISVISDAYSVQLTITTEGYQDYFAINDDGSLQLIRALDYESVQEITLQINASDGTFYSSVPATVHITIQPENDNHPVFAKLEINASLAENLPQDSL